MNNYPSDWEKIKKCRIKWWEIPGVNFSEKIESAAFENMEKHKYEKEEIEKIYKDFEEKNEGFMIAYKDREGDWDLGGCNQYNYLEGCCSRYCNVGCSHPCRYFEMNP